MPEWSRKSVTGSALLICSCASAGTCQNGRKTIYAFRDQGDLAGAPSRPAPDDIMHFDLHVRYYRAAEGSDAQNTVRKIAIGILMATELGLIVSDRLQLMMPIFHVGARFLQMAVHMRGGSVVFASRVRSRKGARGDRARTGDDDPHGAHDGSGCSGAAGHRRHGPLVAAHRLLFGRADASCRC